MRKYGHPNNMQKKACRLTKDSRKAKTQDEQFKSDDRRPRARNGNNMNKSKRLKNYRKKQV